MKYIALVETVWVKDNQYGDLSDTTNAIVVEASNEKEAKRLVKESLKDNFNDNDFIRIFEYKEIK